MGNFSQGSECCTHKTGIIDVVYDAPSNELVHTKTLENNCIVPAVVQVSLGTASRLKEGDQADS